MFSIYFPKGRALSYSPRALGLFLLHHFSYCGSLLASSPEDAECRTDGSCGGFHGAVSRGVGRNSNTRRCNGKNESLSFASARAQPGKHLWNCVFSMYLGERNNVFMKEGGCTFVSVGYKSCKTRGSEYLRDLLLEMCEMVFTIRADNYFCAL